MITPRFALVELKLNSMSDTVVEKRPRTINDEYSMNELTEEV